MVSNFYTTKKGYKVHYQITNNVLPHSTVFLHGNVASNRWWLPTLEQALAQSSGKKLSGAMICIEFLGCGKSEAPRSADDVNVLEFAQDFNDLLRFIAPHYSTNGKFNLVGHSTGGFIAAAMTGYDHRLFNKAFLLDPVGAKGLELTEQIKGGFEAMKSDKSISAMAIGATIYNNNDKSDFFNQVIVEDTYSAVKNISYWVVQSFHGLDATDVIGRSTTRTLVVHGEHDNLLPRTDSEDLALKYLKHAQFKVIPGHGHCMNVENPANFFKTMSDFLFTGA